MSGDTSVSLADVRPRDSFVVVAVRVGKEVGRRLADMGLTEGAEGRVIRRGAFGGPMQLRIGEYDLLLRRDEARGVEVNISGTERGGGRRLRRRRRGA